MTGNQRTDRIMGRWAVQAELGRGSMGRVLLLAEALPGIRAGAMPVACKVLERPELRSDFINEFKLLRRLAQPGFVTPLRLVHAPEVPTGEIVLRPRLFALVGRAAGRGGTPGIDRGSGMVTWGRTTGAGVRRPNA